MLNETYGRGQVEWALWKAFVRSGMQRAEVPKKFLARIKRLLEIDRELDLSDREVQPETEFAFVAPPEKRGGDAHFSAFDAFCMAVALDLMDAGFKQAEVVYLMRHLRADLEHRFRAMLDGPSLNARRRYRASDDPDQPVEMRDGKIYADGRIFLVIQKFEITEALASPKVADHKDPLFLQPEFCSGITALSEALSDAMPDHRRVATVVELAATAQAVCALLEQAPEIRRGRPKS